MTELRRGRRPGAPDTRSEILAAAREEFAERAYDGASIRGIAARAGVDPALVHHYFGTKERLFTAAVDLSFSPEEVATTIAEAPAGSQGERLVRTFFAVWDDPVRRAPLLAILRSAVAHESAARLLRQFARRVMVARVRPALRGPDADLRVEAAVSHLFGLALVRYVIKVEPIASAPVEELVSLVSPSVQRYFDA